MTLGHRGAGELSSFRKRTHLRADRDGPTDPSTNVGDERDRSLMSFHAQCEDRIDSGQAWCVPQAVGAADWKVVPEVDP